MGKKNGGAKTLVIAPVVAPEDSRAGRAFELRSQGFDYERIGDELEVTAWQARELASLGFVRLATEQAEEVRATIEIRYDDLTRRLYDDLKIATNQPTRNAIYTLLLRVDTDRRRLLGVDIPPKEASSDGAQAIR